MDLYTARAVLDKPELPELVHEEVDTRTSRLDHLCEYLLGYFGQHAQRPGSLAVLGEEQECPGQSFLGGVEELIDQVFLHAYVSFQNVRYERVREAFLSV